MVPSFLGTRVLKLGYHFFSCLISRSLGVNVILNINNTSNKVRKEVREQQRRHTGPPILLIPPTRCLLSNCAINDSRNSMYTSVRMRKKRETGFSTVACFLKNTLRLGKEYML